MKRLLCVLLTAALALAFVACTGPGTTKEPGGSKTSEGIDPKDITIAFIPQQLGNPANLDAKSGAEKAAEELGIKLEFQSTATADVPQQIAIVESVINMGVDGIAIAVCSADGLASVINEAVDKGIKVSTFDSDSPNSKRMFLVGIKNYDAGYKCGERLVELTGGKGTVAVLTGMLGAIDLVDRVQGFKDAIADSELEVLTVLSGNDDIDKSVEIVEEYTRANPELTAWYYAGPWTFFTPPESLPETVSWKLADPSHKIVTVDFFWPTAAYFDNEVCDYAVSQSLYEMGYQAVVSTYKAVIGEEVETITVNDIPLVEIPLTEITADNYEEFTKTLTPWD